MKVGKFVKSALLPVQLARVNKVVQSKAFLDLSEDKIVQFLEYNDWYLDEMLVFHHVETWSLSRKDLEGVSLKERMGKSFYAIRFACMKEEDFNGILEEHKGLFSEEEEKGFLDYFSGSEGTPEMVSVLQTFTSRRRIKPESLLLPAFGDENNSCPTESETDDDDHSGESEVTPSSISPQEDGQDEGPSSCETEVVEETSETEEKTEYNMNDS